MPTKSKPKTVIGRAAAKPARKTSRIEARVSAERKSLLQQAADIRGESLSDFVLAASQEKAAMVIQEAQQLRLSAEAQHRFVRALLKPAVPSRRLVAAAERYLKRVR